MPGKHDPNRLRRYIEIHETAMEHFRKEGFVENDSLAFDLSEAGYVRLAGQISCAGGIVIDVDKTLEVVSGGDPSDPFVQTIIYAYNAHLAGGHNILRYDNAPHHGHQDPSHRHTYDWRTGDEELASPTWIGPDWPTLGEVLRELQEWYWEHQDELAG